jgi:hypothetical protein
MRSAISGASFLRPVVGVPGQPFAEVSQFFINPGSAGESRDIITVPDGQLLVIETVAFLALQTIGNDILEVALIVIPPDGGISGRVSYPIAFDLHGSSSSSHYYSGTHAVRIYVGAGSTAAFQVNRGDDEGFTNAFLTVSGYFVNAA